MWASRTTRIASGAAAALLAVASVAAWADRSPGGTAQAVDGQVVFQARGCVGCHAVSGLGGNGFAGPDLTWLQDAEASRVEELSVAEYVEQSIRQPDAFTVARYPADLMPTLTLSDQEIAALIEFLVESQ